MKYSMQFDKEYIYELIEKNRFGLLIKLMEDHINVWSVDNFNCIFTQTMYIFNMMYYMSEVFSKLKRDINAIWTIDDITEGDDMNDYNSGDDCIQFVKHFGSKFGFENMEICDGVYVHEYNYKYILTYLRFYPAYSFLHKFSLAYMSDVIANMNIYNRCDVENMLQRFLKRNSVLVQRYNYEIQQYKSDYMKCRYPNCYRYLTRYSYHTK